MFELVIKRADESVYWREYFNSQPQAQAWLLQEQSRPYWDQSFTVTIIDHSPTPEQLAAEAAAQQSLNTQINTLRQRFSELDGLNDLTAAEVKELIRKLVRFLKLKGFI